MTEEQEQKEIEAQIEQYDINYNKKRPLSIGNGKDIYIYPLVSAVMDRMSSYYTRQQEVFPEDGVAGMIVKLKPNLKLQCKAASLALLNNPNWIIGWLKIHLFHWIHWRIVFWKYSQKEMLAITTFLIEKMGLRFFFQNTVLTMRMNSLAKKMTKEEMEKPQSFDKAEQE